MGNVYFKVNTTVRDPKKKVSIRIRYKEGKIDQSTATGENCELQYWDLKRQQFNRKSFPGKDRLQNRLKKLEVYVYRQAEGLKNIQKGWLLSVVDVYLHPEKAKANEMPMYEWIENFILNSTHAPRTISKYNKTLEGLKDFKPDLSWDQIDLNFYDDYTHHLQRDGYAKNTIGDRIKVLKVFMNAAFERGEHKNLFHRARSFKKETEESLNIYLNQKELDRIYKLDLSSKPYLDKTRDLFLIGCWTGSRYGDWHKVNSDNIHGNFIYMVQEKTGNRVVIPLHPVVKEILDKYSGILPPTISNQKFNDYIKEVAELAKINGKISKSITRGGKRESNVVDKYNMVSSHTARRSFATNLYKSRFPSISIMAMTGHKTEKSFLSYIKVTEEEHAEMLLEHWEKTVGSLKIN